MSQLLNAFGFLSVLLRAAVLACESLVAGGLLFSLLCLEPDSPAVWAACRRLIRWAALGLLLAQLAFVSADAAILHATVGLSFAEIATANFFTAGLASAAAALFCVWRIGWLRAGNWGMLLPGVVMLASSLMTSHAAARIDHRIAALSVTAVHQGATLAWIGGLPFLLLALARGSGIADGERIGNRFSRLAQWSVAAIFLSGIALSLLYVGSIPALYGTSYGIMVLGKALMFAMIIALGALNYGIVRALHRHPEPLLARLKRLTETEIGIGFTVVLAAASLTSQPPAIDLQNGRATVPDIVMRFSPRAPRLHSPAWSELSPVVRDNDPQDPQAPSAATSFVPGGASRPSSPGDIAWSEYNHNWAGLVVLAMGLLAVSSRVFGFRWARHWPLAFLGLSYFLFLRADPDAWPLGPKGFWFSFTDPEVLQHRLFSLMIVAFAVFEWGIQVGRIRSRSAALVFPGVCALGGALLLTHSHALGNVKQEYLAELSHLPIAIFAVAAGWSRWLEQRLDGPWRRLPSMIWPVCFVVIGMMLLFYRES